MIKCKFVVFIYSLNHMLSLCQASLKLPRSLKKLQTSISSFNLCMNGLSLARISIDLNMTKVTTR